MKKYFPYLAVLAIAVAVVARDAGGQVEDLLRHRRHDRRLLLPALLHVLLRPVGRRAHVPVQQRLQVPQGQPLRRRRPLQPARLDVGRPGRRVAPEARPRHADELGRHHVRQEVDARAEEGDRSDREHFRLQPTWKKYAVREDTIEWHDDAKMSHAKLASGMAEITLDKIDRSRQDDAHRRQEPPVLVLQLQRGIRAGVLDAPLRRRDTSSATRTATASTSPGRRRATSSRSRRRRRARRSTSHSLSASASRVETGGRPPVFFLRHFGPDTHESRSDPRRHRAGVPRLREELREDRADRGRADREAPPLHRRPRLLPRDLPRAREPRRAAASSPSSSRASRSRR